MREVGRGLCGNVRHGGELFWRSAAVLQRPWGSGAKLWRTVGREMGEEGGRGRGKGRGTDCDVRAGRSDRSQWDFYTIQYSTSLLCSVRLSAVYPRYPTCCPVTLQAKPTSLYVLPTRCPARCPSGVRTAVIPLSHRRARCCSTLVPSSCASLVRNQHVFWCTAKPMLL